MTIIHISVHGTRVRGFESDTADLNDNGLYLGEEHLATDPDDRDLTGTLNQFNLKTAVAPGEWPDHIDLPAVEGRGEHKGEIVADDVECNCDVSGPVQCDIHGPRE